MSADKTATQEKQITDILKELEDMDQIRKDIQNVNEKIN